MHDVGKARRADQWTFVWHSDVALVRRQPLFVLLEHFAQTDVDPCVLLRRLRVELASQVLHGSVLLGLVLAGRGHIVHRWEVHLSERVCGDVAVEIFVVLVGDAIHHLAATLRTGQLHVVVLFRLLLRLLLFIGILSFLILLSFAVFEAMALDTLR